MTSTTISLFLAAIFLSVGTVIGGILFLVMARALRLPGVSTIPAFLAAFATAFVSGTAYSIVLWALDDPKKELIGPAFLAAAALGIAVSYLTTMRFFEVELSRIPLLWLPVAILLGVCFYAIRTDGSRYKESCGFYRGYERIAYLNLPDPPDAMETPEKAVDFYNAQVHTLKTATEDSGIGKILPAQSHFDAQWFLDNYQFIMARERKQDITGIAAVVNDPAAQKAMALMSMVKPLYGKIERKWEQGKDALVLMSSGQVARFVKEGRNWKICDWLGMRSYMTGEIYDVKVKNKAATPEDEEAKQGHKKGEEELKALCQTAGIAYIPFDPFFDEDMETRPDKVLLGGPKRKKSQTGYSALDTAKPGELVDLSQQKPAATAEATPAPTPAQTPAPAPAPEKTMTAEEKLAQTNAQLDSMAAQMQPGRAPAQVASVVPTTPAPAPEASAQPAPSSVPVDPLAATPVPQGGQPAPQGGQPAPQGSPTPQGTPGLPPGVADDSIPIAPLWQQYTAAVKKLQAGDPAGVVAFHAILSQDDNKWLLANYGSLADMLAPGFAFASKQDRNIFVLKALLRNMPSDAAPGKVVVNKQPASPLALAEITDNSDSVPQVYRTPILQENGKWVLAQPFFVRFFIWTPQLTWYKQSKGMPLAPEEQLFATTGFTQFLQQVRMIYAQVGIGG